MTAKRRLGSRRLDPLLSRLGLFKGGVDRYFDTRDNAVPSATAGPIEIAYHRHTGRMVHKWHHFLPYYDRYFAMYRVPRMKVRMLEIGVSGGGSLELWRGYFGPDAVIFGVDIDPDCARFDGEHGNRVRIGSQADPEFLRSVVAEMGGVDIVLDDGSHVAAHVKASFDTLFPLLTNGGLYVIEDMHTAYWSNYGGSYFSGKSAIGLAKTLIDDIHHWYHPHGQRIAAARDSVAGIHIHDSMVFIEKRLRTAPPDKSRRGGADATRKA